MKNFDPADGVYFFTGRAPDVFAIRIRVRRIAFMHQIVKEPAGDHHALVSYLFLERGRGRKMIKSPGARRYLNDNVLTFVIGVCRICYERDVRILVRCIFCAAIAGFLATRFDERNVTNDCRGFGVFESRAFRECFQCDTRIHCDRRLRAVFERINYIFPASRCRATMYFARRGKHRRREKQRENYDSNFDSTRVHCARSYHFVIAVWRAKEHNSSRKLLEYHS